MIKLGRKLGDFGISLDDILYWPKPVLAIYVHCDNQSTIERAQSSMYNGKSRHYIDYVMSNKNILDLLTKDL